MSDLNLELEDINIDEFTISCIKNDECITEYLRKGYNINTQLDDFINSLYVRGTNMIDIGAHIGTASLVMSRYISKENKIYSF